MNDVDKLRSKYKETMLNYELEKGCVVGEISTNIGTFFVTFKGDEYGSLYDSDKNWLFPIESEEDVDSVVDCDSIQEFADKHDITCIVYSDNQQELVEASRKAGLDDEYDLIYHIGSHYVMFDTPELLNLAELNEN